MERERFGVPTRFLWALVVMMAFALFLAADQAHWWQLRPDYAFGWLVPVFAGYVIVERWRRLRELTAAPSPSRLQTRTRQVLNLLAGAGFVLGLSVFLLGAFYRAGAGETQPGSLAMAIGFSGVALGIAFFNTPERSLAPVETSGFWSLLRREARVQALCIFLFPAVVWVISAPLVSSVEVSVSVFLLRKVVAVVFWIFNLLGCSILQEGNVLVLPLGRVGVADACSGIRSLTGCLFAGSFLAAVFLDRFWKKVVLVALSLGFAFVANLARSLFLTALAYNYGSDAIEGRVHDITGFAVLGITAVGLLCFLPLFRTANWQRWLGLDGRSEPSP